MLLGLAAGAQALAQQDYPSRPIRLITPAAQGGTTDLLARVFGARLAEVFKQQVVVDNRAGAAGVIAGELTANAPPDGYTLLLAYHQHTINAALNPKLPYHPVNSFTPITQLTSAALMLVVNPATPVRSLEEFLSWTRNYPGPLNYGSAGNGSGGHPSGERSGEHTSELQSPCNLVCRLLLEKKKKKNTTAHPTTELNNIQSVDRRATNNHHITTS